MTNKPGVRPLRPRERPRRVPRFPWELLLLLAEAKLLLLLVSCLARERDRERPRTTDPPLAVFLNKHKL